MIDDPILYIVSRMREVRLTAAQAEVAVRILADGEPNLFALLRAAPAAELESIRVRYPQGLKALLEGVPTEHGLPAVEGFGSRPYSEFTTARVGPQLVLYQAHVAARLAQRYGPGGRAGSGSRDGYAAARQFRYAARAVAGLLLRHGLLASDPLPKLPVPKAPGRTRDRALTLQERRDFCRIVMLNSPDPVLAALTWILFAVTGARGIELQRLTQADLNPARGSVVLVGKGGGRRERPVHSPVVDLLTQLLSGRAPSPDGTLLRSEKGHPVTGRTWDGWSRRLHLHAAWAAGVPIGVHALRHSTARMVMEAGYDTAETGRYLGHAAPSGLRVTVLYTMDRTTQGDWEFSCAVAGRVFGPLDGWPLLPENDILDAVLGVGLPQVPSGTGQGGRGRSKADAKSGRKASGPPTRLDRSRPSGRRPVGKGHRKTKGDRGGRKSRKHT